MVVGCVEGSAIISPLQDGLLLTKVNDLLVQSAEWTVLVVIDAPTLDPLLLRSINTVLRQSAQALSLGIISADSHQAWVSRLRSAKSYILNHSIPPPSSSTRSKRGWFDFVGWIGHTLFGLATDDSVKACRRAIEQTRKYQKVVVHQVNQLTTVLNRTRTAVSWNRYQIQQVTLFIAKSLIPKLNEALQALNHTNIRLSYLERSFYFERSVSLLEQVTATYIRATQRYNRQKASLEIGRLTEDILSVSQLQDIMKQATTLSTHPIQPLQWYYEHTHIYPVWGDSTLVYRVKLPLVDKQRYHRYHIATWPVPYAGKDYSIQLQVEHEHVGMNTANGGIFHPVGCVGWQPMVCRTGPIYSANRWGCSRTLISGVKRQRHQCQVIIRKTEKRTEITEISYGEYILVTWGETVVTRCTGKGSTRQTIKAGTYVVVVPALCIIMGDGWTLTGLIERVGHVSVTALRVTLPDVFNITDVIPSPQAIALLDDPRWSQVNPVAQVKLAPISDLPPKANWISKPGNKVSLGLAIITVVFSILGISVGLYCWWKRFSLFSLDFPCFKKPDYSPPGGKSKAWVDSEIVAQPRVTAVDLPSMDAVEVAEPMLEIKAPGVGGSLTPAGAKCSTQ